MFGGLKGREKRIEERMQRKEHVRSCLCTKRGKRKGGKNRGRKGAMERKNTPRMGARAILYEEGRGRFVARV